MGFFSSWRGLPVFCWAYDTPEAWQDAFGKDLYKDRIKDYSKVYDAEIAPILFEMGMKFNLGGEQDKSRLETTSRPIGVFDFSLASKGLYRVQEYYSQELAIDHPNLFDTFELPSGIVPPNLVDNITIGGVKNFVYNHNGKMYVLDKRQKGTTAINDGEKDAKLKFATSTKDVYLKFKRVGGKVKYAEIYSLFYYTSLDGNDEFAIRHLPALMTAEYFESMGIKTRVYMTRFCNPEETGTLRQNDLLTNAELPMYTQQVNYSGSSRFDDEIIFAPIIVKDFGQELDWKSCLVVSQNDSHAIYDGVVKNMLRNEIDGRIISPYGSPDQTQERYLEAFARYKEKYQLYVKAGIWKSKEIQEDSQLLFHSQSIRRHLSDVRDSMQRAYSNNNKNQVRRWKDILEGSVVARTFFEWWMKTAAGRCRDTLMIMNAKEPRKEMQKVIDELKARIDDINSYLLIVVPQTYATNNAKNDLEKEIARIIVQNDFVKEILQSEGLMMDFNGEYKYETYLNRIITDATTYASNPLFATDDDTIERLNERADLLYNDIKLRS
jgi:hypothetical protein